MVPAQLVTSNVLEEGAPLVALGPVVEELIPMRVATVKLPRYRLPSPVRLNIKPEVLLGRVAGASVNVEASLVASRMFVAVDGPVNVPEPVQPETLKVLLTV